jgi:hypothetical protein
MLILLLDTADASQPTKPFSWQIKSAACSFSVHATLLADAASADLLLGLVQPTLPQYGENYEQLAIQV